MLLKVPMSEIASPRIHADPTQTSADGSTKWIIIGVIAAVAIAPMFFYPMFVMKVMCFAVFALSFSLLFGYSGLLCFGHAAFFGFASYVTAHGLKVWSLTPELAVLLGTFVALCLGTVFGALAIRRQGLYFSMITLALAQMVYFICLRAPFTRGEDGIQSVPRGHLFGVIDLSNDLNLYACVGIVFIGVMLLAHRVVNSPFGRVLSAIKDNEQRAISLGYRVNRHKLIAFVIAATLAGLAGSMKAVVFQLASLQDVHFAMSGEVVMMSLLGGVNTLLGPIIGSLIVLTMENYLAPFGSVVTIIQGAVFIVCVLAFRDGICGVLSRRFQRSL